MVWMHARSVADRVESGFWMHVSKDTSVNLEITCWTSAFCLRSTRRRAARRPRGREREREPGARATTARAQEGDAVSALLLQHRALQHLLARRRPPRWPADLAAGAGRRPEVVAVATRVVVRAHGHVRLFGESAIRLALRLLPAEAEPRHARKDAGVDGYGEHGRGLSLLLPESQMRQRLRSGENARHHGMIHAMAHGCRAASSEDLRDAVEARRCTRRNVDPRSSTGGCAAPDHASAPQESQEP